MCQEIRQRLALRCVESRFCQPEHHAIQDLARRFARKRRGQNLVRRNTLMHQSQISIRQLKGLATAGRRANQNVWIVRHTRLFLANVAL